MSGPLILSLFPGIDLLGRAFEEEWPEACVVRGPDLLWGGDIRRFHPPAGKFDGVIGGPPCKGESQLAHLNGKPGVSMQDEFSRCVRETRARWYVMEAVKARGMCLCVGGPTGGSAWGSPLVHDAACPGWATITTLSPRWLGEKQSRVRHFHSNLDLRPFIEQAALEPTEYKYAVLAGHGGAEGSVYRRMATYAWPEMCELQGLPPAFDIPGFTRAAKREAVGNGVPLPMGRAIARAVRRAVSC